jgi:hypothetical protein
MIVTARRLARRGLRFARRARGAAAGAARSGVDLLALAPGRGFSGYVEPRCLGAFDGATLNVDLPVPIAAPEAAELLFVPKWSRRPKTVLELELREDRDGWSAAASRRIALRSGRVGAQPLPAGDYRLLLRCASGSEQGTWAVRPPHAIAAEPTRSSFTRPDLGMRLTLRHLGAAGVRLEVRAAAPSVEVDDARLGCTAVEIEGRALIRVGDCELVAKGGRGTAPVAVPLRIEDGRFSARLPLDRIEHAEADTDWRFSLRAGRAELPVGRWTTDLVNPARQLRQQRLSFLDTGGAMRQTRLRYDKTGALVLRLSGKAQAR